MPVAVNTPWNRSSRVNRLNSTENRSNQWSTSLQSILLKDLTRLKIDRLGRLASLHKLFIFIFMLRNFSWAACLASSYLSICHNHGLCSYDWKDRVAIWHVDWPHIVLDRCPHPNRPSVTFPDKGHSRSLNICCLITQTAQGRCMVKKEQYLEVRSHVWALQKCRY